MRGEGPAGFWSYTHRDDELDSGRIKRLAESIRNEYELTTGEPLDLFIDKRSIEWGQEWRERIDNALTSTTFFIPVVTPKFFESEECRRELVVFAGHARSLGVEELLLPILYIRVPALDDEDPPDEPIALVKRTQYEDWTKLRLADEASAEYRQAVHRLAERLASIASEVSERPEATTPAEEPEDDTPGFLDLVALGEEAMPRLVETVNGFPPIMETITRLTQEASADMASSDQRGKGFAGRLAVSRRLARDFQEPAAELLRLGSDYASLLVELDPAILSLIRRAGDEADDSEDLASVCEFLRGIGSMVSASAETRTTLDGFIDSLSGVAEMSRDLRKPLNQMRDGVRQVIDGHAILEEWQRRIDETDIDCSSVPLPEGPND